MAIQSFIENGARFDGDTYSLKYFNVSKNFTLLKKGKNTITLAPDFTVVPGSKIEVELLDKFGNPIRVEYPNQITPNGDLVLHITIDDTVPEGAARMYIRGVAYKDVDTGLKLDTSRFNIIWRGLSEIKLSDDSDTPKDPDDIVFDKPTKDIEIEVVKKDVNYRDKDSDRPTTYSGVALLTYFPIVESSTFSSNVANKPTTRTKQLSRPISDIVSGGSTTTGGNPISNSDGYPTIKSSQEEFTSDMEGGKITITPIITDKVPSQLVDSIGSVSDYSATILEVVNSTTIVVDTHFYHTVPNGNTPFIVDSFTGSSYSINYNKNVPTTDGQKVTGFAQMCFNNVSTSNGKVDKVRVSAKPVGSIGGPILIGDYDITPPNKMQDTSSFDFNPRTGLGYKNVGDVTSNDDITNYYDYTEYSINNNTSSTLDTYTYDEVIQGLAVNAPSQRDLNLINAINVESPIEDTNVLALTVKDEFLGSAKADTKYKIALNAYSENDSTAKTPIAKLFISGPSILEGGDTSNTFGTLIDTIEGGNGQTQKNLEFFFTAATDSEKVKLHIVLETGIWDFSGIRLEPASTTNNSPNEFCILVPLDNLPVNKIDEEYVFVIDFIGENGNPTNVNLTSQSVTLNSNSTIDQTLLINTFNSSTIIQNAISGSSKWYANEGGTCAEVAGGDTFNFSEGSVIDMSMDAPSKTLTICHGAVSAAGNVTATSNYFIDSVTLDSFGHVTGLTTNCVIPGGYFWCASDGTTTCQIDTTEIVSIKGCGDTTVTLGASNTYTICTTNPTVNDCTITITAGTGLTGGGSFSLNQSSNSTITLCATGGGVTINNNVDNYVVTATGTANTLCGESTLTYNNSTGTLSVTGAGGVCVTNCVTADNFITTSDIRLKSDIKELKCSIDVLKKFKSYAYIKGGYEDAGFIAQEVCEAIPYTVTTNTEGYLTMRDRPILAYMHNAIVELNNRIDCLESKIGK